MAGTLSIAAGTLGVVAEAPTRSTPAPLSVLPRSRARVVYVRYGESVLVDGRLLDEAVPPASIVLERDWSEWKSIVAFGQGQAPSRVASLARIFDRD